MKLSVAAFALGASALLVGRTASAEYVRSAQGQGQGQYVPSAGTCLSTVAAMIGSGELQRQNVNWNNKAAYYANVDDYYLKNYDNYFYNGNGNVNDAEQAGYEQAGYGNWNQYNNANNEEDQQAQDQQGQYDQQDQNNDAYLAQMCNCYANNEAAGEAGENRNNNYQYNNQYNNEAAGEAGEDRNNEEAQDANANADACQEYCDRQDQAQYQAQYQPAVTRTAIYNGLASLAETLEIDIDDYNVAGQAQNAEANYANNEEAGEDRNNNQYNEEAGEDRNNNANDQYNNADADAYAYGNGKWASATSGDCDLDLLSNYVLAYDEELAETLDIGDRCTFSQFYDLTVRLIQQGGCDALLEMQNAEENEEKELVKNIFEYCQDEYAAIGINLEEIDVNDEKINDLEIHMQIEEGIASFQLADATADEFYEYLRELGIDIDDEDQMNVMLMQAVKSGDFTRYLLENGYYGSNVQGQDWKNILMKYFMLKGIVDNYDDVDEVFEQIDEYTAATIYNAVHDVEEYGCEQAMIAQFGTYRAGRQGFTDQSNLVDAVLDSFNIDRNNLPTYMTDTEGNLTAGAAAGISFGVIAAVALVSFGAYKVGRSYSSTDKKVPLISDAYQKDGLTVPGADIKAAMEARKVARFRTSIV